MGQSHWRALKHAAWLVATLAILLLIVLPLATSLWVQLMPNPPASMSKYLRWIESLQHYSLSLIAGVYFFLLGSCFASFLNVVAWRVPRGRSILGHSSCPHCNRRLGFRDNFPIIGWLRNQGQCSSCQSPISPRYLVVEVVLGSLFLLVALATLASGGMTLPVRPPNDGTGFVRVLFDPKWDLIQIVAGQLCLLLFLFTFALIDLERFPIPKSILMIGIFVGFGCSLVAPAMFLFDYTWPMVNRWPMDWGSLNLIFTVFIGMLAGGICGKLLNRLLSGRLNQTVELFESEGVESDDAETQVEQESQAQPAVQPVSEPTLTPSLHQPSAVDSLPMDDQPSTNLLAVNTLPKRVPTSFYYGMVLCGLFLGWQSAIIISAWVALLAILWPQKIRVGQYSLKTGNSLLFVACIIHLMTWRWMDLLGN